MTRRLFCYMPFVFAAILVSCGRNENTSDKIIPSFSTYRALPSDETPVREAKREIFYGLLTPIEVCNIFERLGVPYDEARLNPEVNAANYMSSSRTAINLGVYGVDLGYLKLFRKNQDMFNYMLIVRELSGRLNIPESYLAEPVRRVEADMDNPDSIMVIMNRAYKNIEDHLRIDGRESVLGLMLMGGWVEAMYLATSLAYDETNPDPEVVQKIAEQKYTLTSLLSLMKNYYDDPMVVFYTKKLLFLKRYFDTFDIYFRQGDLEINTVRQTLVSTGSEMTVTIATLNNIRNYVAKFRAELVE